MNEKVRGIGELQTRTFLIPTASQIRSVETDDDGNRIYTATAYGYDDGTPNTVDTYGTTIARGAFAHVTPDDFRMLEYHNANTDPIGKPISITEDPVGPQVKFILAPTSRAQNEIKPLLDGGFLRAVSVGFMPLEGYVRKATVSGGQDVVVFTKCDLHELSLVNAPSSKQALIDLSRELGTDERAMAELYKDVIREATPGEKLRDMALAIKTRDAASGLPTSQDVINDVLQLALIADTALDLITDMLSDLLGVVNPDVSQDEALEDGAPADATDGVTDSANSSDVDLANNATIHLAARVEVMPVKVSARSALRRLRR